MGTFIPLSIPGESGLTGFNAVCGEVESVWLEEVVDIAGGSWRRFDGLFFVNHPKTFPMIFPVGASHSFFGCIGVVLEVGLLKKGFFGEDTGWVFMGFCVIF